MRFCRRKTFRWNCFQGSFFQSSVACPALAFANAVSRPDLFLGTSTFPCSGCTSAYPGLMHQALAFCTILPTLAYGLAACSSCESVRWVIPFRMSIWHDFRYDTLRRVPCRVNTRHGRSAWPHRNHSPFGPAYQPLGRLTLTTFHPCLCFRCP
jgi:hypothetical protein